MSIKTGDILQITSGIYDDYGVECLLEAVKDFDLASVRDAWYKEHCKLVDDTTCTYRGEPIKLYELKGQLSMAFSSYLCSEGYTKDKDYLEVHTGEYDEAKITWYGDNQ